MKNLKNFAFGLLVAVLAVGFSAFKNSNKVTDPMWIYVQTDTDEYTRLPFNEVDPGACKNATLQECSFSQYDNQDNGSPLTHAQVSSIPDIEPSAQKGLYDPL